MRSEYAAGYAAGHYNAAHGERLLCELRTATRAYQAGYAAGYAAV